MLFFKIIIFHTNYEHFSCITKFSIFHTLIFCFVVANLIYMIFLIFKIWKIALLVLYVILVNFKLSFVSFGFWKYSNFFSSNMLMWHRTHQLHVRKLTKIFKKRKIANLEWNLKTHMTKNSIFSKNNLRNQAIHHPWENSQNGSKCLGHLQFSLFSFECPDYSLLFMNLSKFRPNSYFTPCFIFYLLFLNFFRYVSLLHLSIMSKSIELRKVFSICTIYFIYI